MDKCDEYDFSHPPLLDQCQPTPAPRDDYTDGTRAPLDTTAELEARVTDLLREIEERATTELHRISTKRHIIGIALLRAQRDAARRAYTNTQIAIGKQLA